MIEQATFFNIAPVITYDFVLQSQYWLAAETASTISTKGDWISISLDCTMHFHTTICV